MKTPLVLTFIGDDRPGLVSVISERIAASGGTWLESRSARLAGKFAGILLVSIADDRLAGLELSLRQLELAGLRLTIDRGVMAPGDRTQRLIALDIVGHERPGIVRDVTQALNHLGVNIEEFVSGLEGAPFSGEAMFRATARLRAPEGLALEDLRKSLERLAGEIMVDLTIGEGGTGA